MVMKLIVCLFSSLIVNSATIGTPLQCYSMANDHSKRMNFIAWYSLHLLILLPREISQPFYLGRFVNPFLRSPVSAIHPCVQLDTGDVSWFSFWRTLSYLWRHFFCPARLFFAGVTFFCLARLFCWHNFFSLVQLFFAGATFFSGSIFWYCRPLPDLLPAQVTNTCSCEQDGWLGGPRFRPCLQGGRVALLPG